MPTVVHDELFKTGYFEGIQENLKLFNGASEGCIVMTERRVKGDFEKEAYWNGVVPILDRDPTSNALRPEQSFGGLEHVGVKVPFKTPRMVMKYEEAHRGGRTMDEFSYQLGRSYAQSEMSHRLSAGIAALKAATIAAGAAMNITSPTLDAMALADLTGAYGDQADLVKMLLMHSGARTTLVKTAITSNRLGESGVVVYGAEPGTLGRPTLVRDDIALKETTHWVVMALTAGAIEISDNSQPPVLDSGKDSTKENISFYWTAEGTFNLTLKGYSWNTTTGGANPTTAELATTANWTKVATSNKALAAAKLVV